MENEQTTISENKFKILTLKLLRKDKNVAQKLFGSEKHVFWSENQLFPGTFIRQPFFIKGISASKK